MQPELLIAIFTGLGGMLGWGFADFFAKKTIDKIGDITTLFWGQLIGVLPLLVLFLLNPSIPELSNLELFYLPVLGIWSALSYIPVYIAFGKGKVSLISPIFASYAVVVAILSAIFLHEIIPLNRFIAFLTVFIGILFINGDPRSFLSLFTGGKDNKVSGLPEIILAICLYSGWLIALDQFLSDKNWVPLLLMIRIFSTLTLFVYARMKGRNLVIIDNSLWKYLVLIGLFDVAAFSFVSWGFSATSYVSIVAILSGAFSLPTIILARLFLKEKVTMVQTIGSVIIIAGIALLSLNS